MQKDDQKISKQKSRDPIALGGPLSFWIGILIIAAAIQEVILPISQHYVVNTSIALLNTFAGYLLYTPGILILPIIVGLWVGDLVGSTEGSYSDILYRSIINAIYTSIVYAVCIFVIYISSQSLNAGSFSSISFITFLDYILAVPILIQIVIVPLFAMLTSARRY